MGRAVWGKGTICRKGTVGPIQLGSHCKPHRESGIWENIRGEKRKKQVKQISFFTERTVRAKAIRQECPM